MLGCRLNACAGVEGRFGGVPSCAEKQPLATVLVLGRHGPCRACICERPGERESRSVFSRDFRKNSFVSHAMRFSFIFWLLAVFTPLWANLQGGLGDGRALLSGAASWFEGLPKYRECIEVQNYRGYLMIWGPTLGILGVASDGQCICPCFWSLEHVD